MTTLRTEHRTPGPGPPGSRPPHHPAKTIQTLRLMTTQFDDWTENRTVPFLGTNTGARPLPFQSWHRFKEAFPPELVRRALTTGAGIHTCLDPFGGSGTTALAAQFLGVSSTTVEVNPFLVDLIRAKTAHYDADQLAVAFGRVLRIASTETTDPKTAYASLPPTFIEPGVSDRWLFNYAVAQRVATFVSAIDSVDSEDQRRFFRVLMGGLLVDVSNVVVSGKGRRYRRDWRSRPLDPTIVDHLFVERARAAISDVHRYSSRPQVGRMVIHGDARTARIPGTYDAAVFSPPYPNSFDYTDVYNIELWMLRYLTTAADNQALRHATMTSHVQLHRSYHTSPTGSPTLQTTINDLMDIRAQLWSPWIPDMVGGYFADLLQVLTRVHQRLRSQALCWLVVGDSRYGGVFVPTARILTELAPTIGWRLHASESVRAMRSSAQHGGRNELAETLLVLQKHSPNAC